VADRCDEMPEMRPLRRRIDALDRRIVVPLSVRAELARENELSRSQVVQRAVKARLLKTIVTAALAAQSSR
jgi:chorismate mutase